MRPIIRTDQAEADLEEILSYLMSLSPGAADRLSAEIDELCRLLSSQPKMGRIRDELSPGLRSMVADHRYVLFYRFDDESITVVRILHGSRDVDSLMAEE